MELLLSILLFAAGLAFIIKGGGFLVDSAIGLGKITRMSTVFIGATFMALATALPELFLSIFAVTSGNYEIATGNAIGGMIANMALVLGLYITFMPGGVSKSEVTSKNIFLMITLLAVFWVVSDLTVTWVEGTFLLGGFFLYLYISTKRGKIVNPTYPNLIDPTSSKPTSRTSKHHEVCCRANPSVNTITLPVEKDLRLRGEYSHREFTSTFDRQSDGANGLPEHELDTERTNSLDSNIGLCGESRREPTATLPITQSQVFFDTQADVRVEHSSEQKKLKELKKKTILGFLFGQILLIGGAFLLVKNGENIATLLDLSESFIGFTVIAVGTSAPELTTVFTSIKRKKGCLALGNILGANIITATLLMGTLGLIGGSLPLSRQTFAVALPILAIVSMLAILPIIIKGRTYRWQGVALLTIYIAYIIYLGVVQPV